ncbi:hypothetical protein [Streptomyces sp. NPDC006879]|uniref:hypothetical protein n=1 Tax=Streptomyces sp. NPDC006879 TaxID=3364767 RepID=UPI00369C7F24
MRLFAFCDKNGDETVSENDTPIRPDAGEAERPATLLRDIVRAAIDKPGENLRSLSARAVDPETGQKIAHNTLPKIASGEGYRRERWIIGAVAAATGLPLETVQAAASAEWTGLDVAKLRTSKPGATVVVAYAEGTDPQDLPVLQQKLKELGLGNLRILPDGGGDAVS